MDFKNFGDIKCNSKYVAAKLIDGNCENHMANCTNGNNEVIAGSNSFIKTSPRTPILIQAILNDNNSKNEVKHKNVYNTITYTNCDRKQLNLRRINSQIQDAESRLHAYYLPRSIDSLNTPSVPNEAKCETNDTNLMLNEKSYTEKATYCRPVLNMYNQEFIFKTMERNTKLKRIVKKLIQTRQAERRRDDWNNYINELKNKHRYDAGNPVPGPTGVSVIDDYSTKFGWKLPDPCRDILQDIYDTGTDEYGNNNSDDDSAPIPSFNPYIFETNSCCYPTASQGYLHTTNKERMDNIYVNHWKNRPPSRYYRGNTIIIDRDTYRTLNIYRHYPAKQTVNRAVDVNFNTGLVSKSVSIQKDLNLLQSFKSKGSFTDKFNAVTRNIKKLKNKLTKSEDSDNDDSLVNLEDKLNDLINNINSVLVEIKTKKPQSNREMGVNCKVSDEKKLSTAKSDTYGLISKLETYPCTQAVTKSTIAFADFCGSKNYESNMSQINEILNEEMDKSNKIKQDIERLLTRKVEKPCSVQITFDLPTKERSTEVTASLSKAKADLEKRVIIEEVDPPRRNDERMTIAVNTDPLSLLALLRVSTETVKQMLSCMPNIDYYSYLSMLQPVSRSTVAHYVCNICGAGFGRPSQLSDHIQEHNLGKTRDCCVCRHVLDSRRQRQGLFACKHCGQRFTRAYCCELHQETCARESGFRHEANPDLLLLT